jgi:hypothetical protein
MDLASWVVATAAPLAPSNIATANIGIQALLISVSPYNARHRASHETRRSRNAGAVPAGEIGRSE